MYGGQGGGGWPIPNPQTHINGGMYSNVATSHSSSFSNSYPNGSQPAQSMSSRMHPGIQTSSVAASSIYTNSNNHQLSTGGLMLPPPSNRSSMSSSGRHPIPPNKTGTTPRQKEKEQAALQRRLEQQEREQAKKATQDLFATPGLFSEPERIVDENDGQVAQVLGMFPDAHKVINSKTACIGIDYQPPTPAPSQHHHMIGDEDDEQSNIGPHQTHSSMSGLRMSDMGQSAHNRHQLTQQHQLHLQGQRRGPPSMPRLPSSQRLPENINQTHRPTDKGATRQMSNVNPRQLPPPTGAPPPHMRSSLPPTSQPQPYPSQGPLTQRNSSPILPYSHQNSQQQSFLRQSGHPQSAPYVAPDVTLSTSNRLKQTGKALPKLSLDNNIDDEKFQAMLREMKSMPPPLTAIVTPRVDPSSHMGNTARLGEPKYFNPASLPSLMKPIESPPRSTSIASLASLPTLIEPIESPPLFTKMEPPNEVPLISRAQEFSNSKSLPVATSVKVPCLSEDSDSDNQKPSKRQANPVMPSKPVPVPIPEPEPVKPNSSSGESSSDESSSDESSSEDEDKQSSNNKSDKSTGKNRSKLDPLNDDDDDDDESNCIDNVFSLSSLIGRVRSTHSPSGPHSNLSQHQPSPRHSDNIASSLTSLGLPSDSPTDTLDKDDDDPISGFLSHTPQPLPDLITMPLSPMPRSPLPPPPQLPPPSTRGPQNASMLNSMTSDEEIVDMGEARIKRKRPTKSPTKRQQQQRKASLRISEDSDNEQQQEQNRASQRLTPARTIPGRPLPRASATPVAKSPTQSDDDDDVVIDPLPDMSKKPRKRRTKNPETLKRNQKKSGPSTPSAPRPAVASNAYISSSSSDDDAPPKENGKDSPINHRWNNKRGGGKTTETASSRNRQARGGKSVVKIEEEDDEKGSEKERSNKKTAISMIFASSKAGKNTGKSGIKVEVHHQTTVPLPTPSPQMSVLASPPTVAIKSQGLSNAATLISQSPVHHLLDTPKKTETVIRRRSDGRPVLVCRIPLDLLGPALRDLFTQRHNELKAPEQQPATRDRRSSECSTVSTASSRLSYKRRRRREDTMSESGSTAQHPAKRIKSEFNSSLPVSSSSVDSANLMPPPNRVFYSYMEHRRSEEEEFVEGDYDEYMSMAKKLKHEGDAETIREQQAIKYLRAVLYFSLCGNYSEVRGEKQNAFNLYKDTLDLVRHVSKNPTLGSIDNKLSVLSHRCQSLLYLRLYKLRKQELTECQKILGDHLLKATSGSEQNSPHGQQQQHQPTISPTPSPAGSEGSVCSKSSGYTSASELMGGGIPSGHLAAPPSLTVPQSVMQKQHQYCNFLSQCHELWEKADFYAHRGHCEDFIIRLDRMFGPLTLHSSVKDLVKYTQAGLEILSKEKEKEYERS